MICGASRAHDLECVKHQPRFSLKLKVQSAVHGYFAEDDVTPRVEIEQTPGLNHGRCMNRTAVEPWCSGDSEGKVWRVTRIVPSE